MSLKNQMSQHILLSLFWMASCMQNLRGKDNKSFFKKPKTKIFKENQSVMLNQEHYRGFIINLYLRHLMKHWIMKEFMD